MNRKTWVLFSLLVVLMSIVVAATADSESDSENISDASSSSRLPYNTWYPPWMAVGLTCVAVLLPACLLFTLFFCKGTRTVNYVSI